MKKRDLYYERIPTKLLREDFRLLGTFLGRVIKNQEGRVFLILLKNFGYCPKILLRTKTRVKFFQKYLKKSKNFHHKIHLN